MRFTAVALSVLGALMSLYVPVAAYQNNVGTGFATPIAFFVIGAAFAFLGIAGGLLTWRGRKLGRWLLLLGTIGGLAAWPWLVPAIVYLLAAAASIVALWTAPRTPGTSAAGVR